MISLRTLMICVSEDDMEPNSQGQQDEQVPAVDGDDVLEQASGGKGVVRNGFSLD